MKWVLTPLALAALGYLVIGPRIGRTSGGEKAGEEIRSAIQRDTQRPEAARTAQEASPHTSETHNGPSFDVSVLPVSEPPPQAPVRHRRHRSQPKPSARDTAAPNPAPGETSPPVETPDPASTNGGDGGTTAG
jgi:hypothetical protein